MRPSQVLRSRAGAALAGLVLVALIAVPVTAGQADIAAVRQATDRYHDVQAAIADGYGPFYVCTEQPGVGAMGQHFANGALVGDPAIDPLRPEVLVYAPQRNGEYRLVAIEYVTLDPLWQAAFPGQTPTLFGEDLEFVEEGNRYGLPDFWERHVWLWQGNPAGLFEDWNPNVSCLGQGDNGG